MSVHALRAVVGFVCLLPAGTLIVSGLLGRNPPAALIHPLVLMGGLMAALFVNLASTLSIEAKCKDGAVLGGVAIQVRGRLMNLAVVMIGVLFLSTIALYLFVENFAPR